MKLIGYPFAGIALTPFQLALILHKIELEQRLYELTLERSKLKRELSAVDTLLNPPR